MTNEDIARILGAKPETRFYGFIGLAGVGKDWLAHRLGFGQIRKWADPIYDLAAALYPGQGFTHREKRKPGSRELLQQLGAWGRGEVSTRHPLTASRALFQWALSGIAARAGIDRAVDWDAFGQTDDFWVKAGLARLPRQSNDAIVFTDCRFPNEVEAITRLGGHVVLVVCRQDTLAKRRQELGYETGLDDSSEKLAEKLTKEFFDSGKTSEPVTHTVFYNDDNEPSGPDFAVWAHAKTLHGSPAPDPERFHVASGDPQYSQGS